MNQMKVERKAKLRIRYNQVPCLTQKTTWESDKITKKTQHTREPRGEPFPQATRNRQDIITKIKCNINNKKYPQRSNALEWSAKKQEGINMFNGTNLIFSSDVDQDTQMFGSHEIS